MGFIAVAATALFDAADGLASAAAAGATALSQLPEPAILLLAGVTMFVAAQTARRRPTRARRPKEPALRDARRPAALSVREPRPSVVAFH